MADASLTVPAALLRDVYDCIDDLMPGIGNLAISADRIRRLNETMVALGRLVHELPPRPIRD